MTPSNDLVARLRADMRRYVGYDVPGMIARIDALIGDRT